jgi:hypothetical protein
MKTKLISLAELLFIGTMVLTASKMLASTTPPGWKLLIDKTKNCQISVPSDWVVSTFSPSVADSPDNKSDVRMEVTNLGHTLREFKVTAEQIYAPIKIFEDSKRHLWFSYKEANPPEDSRIMYYFVGIPVDGNVCVAQIHFDNRRVEPVAKQITESLAAAK